jgi:hypothetical protein
MCGRGRAGVVGRCLKSWSALAVIEIVQSLRQADRRMALIAVVAAAIAVGALLGFAGPGVPALP